MVVSRSRGRVEDANGSQVEASARVTPGRDGWGHTFVLQWSKLGVVTLGEEWVRSSCLACDNHHDLSATAGQRVPSAGLHVL